MKKKRDLSAKRDVDNPYRRPFYYLMLPTGGFKTNYSNNYVAGIVIAFFKGKVVMN